MTIRIHSLALLLLSISSLNPNQSFSQTAQKTPYSVMTYDQRLKLSFEDKKQMAEQGDTDVQIELGDFYCFRKNRTKEDFNEGFRWYKKAIDSGNGRGAWYLAQVYQHGVDGNPDMEEAVKWLWKGSDLGDYYSTTSLAKGYRDGTNGVTQDYSIAIKLFQKLVDKGDKNAIFQLAKMYLEGQGVKKNPEKVRALLKSQGKEKENGTNEILLELDGYKFVKPETGDFVKDRPDFPPFSIWRDFSGKSYRQQTKEDRKKFKVYLIDKDGKLQKEENSEEDYDTYISNYANKANLENQLNRDKKEWPSFDGSWSYDGGEFRDESFRMTDKRNKININVLFPTNNDAIFPLLWNSSKNVFYFNDVGGDSTEHFYSLWQFEPANKIFISVFMSSGNYFFSPDGKWIVSSDGELHIYNVEKNVDYKLLDGKPRNIFYKWGKK